MSTEPHNYHDNNFNLYQAYSYTLLLKLEATTFSYAVLDQKRLLYYSGECEMRDLTDAAKIDDILSARYSKTVIGLPASALTLIPNSLYDASHVSTLARYLDVKPTEKVLVQTLDSDNTIIYKTAEHITAITEKFDGANVVFAAEGWIKVIEKSHPQGNKLYLDIGTDKVQILYITGGKLRFYNTYDFKSPDELVYFTTFVAEELNLKPQYITLVLSGDIESGDKNANRLGDFFRLIEFNDVKAAIIPTELTAHKLLALAALSLCGSSEAY